jgi:hypothetical protein
MGLHAALAPLTPQPEPSYRFAEEGDEDIDDEEEFSEYYGECLECGSSTWHDVQYGTYSQIIEVHLSDGSGRAEYGSMDPTGVDDADGWECENGHGPSDYLMERLDEA